MSIGLKQAAEQVLKELGEARKILRASSSRQLAKDWDRRATDALANLRTAIQQPATDEPVLVQHRKPVEGWSGETIGYTAWRDGKGLDWWPHRELYDRPKPNVPMTNEQWDDVLGSAGPDMLDLAKQWADNKVHVYQVVNEAEKIVKAAVLRGIFGTGTP